jgi:hypothetical protein
MRAFILKVMGLVLLIPALVASQAFQGGIRGAVRDADGGVLPGTTVTLTNAETGAVRTSVTNERGEFVFASVAPGTYHLGVELSGFAPFRREGLEIGVATQLVQDVSLQVGGIAESVTVTGETPLIETANANVASAIDKAQLEVLPTPGRNVFIFAVTTPNIVHTGDPVFVRQQDQTNSSLLSLGGGPLRGNNYTVDGVSITDMRNRAVIIPGMEGTEEMKVQVNTYDAEVGRTGGAVFNTIHKSGTNNWNGSSLYQTRPKWGRSPSFFESEKAGGTGEVGDAPWHLYGGSFGGPIVRDKAFFYFSTEGYKGTDLRNDVMTFPSTAMANGDFSAFGRQIYNPFATDAAGNRIAFPGNVIPSNFIDPVGRNLAQQLAQVGQAAGCPAVSAEPCNVGATAYLDNIAWQWTTNVNASVTDNWQMSGTWMFYDSEEPSNDYYTTLLGEKPVFDTGGATLFRRSYILALNSTHIMNESDVLTLRYGWTYFDDTTSNPAFSNADARGLGWQGDWLDQLNIVQFPYIYTDGYGDPSANSHGSWTSNDIKWKSMEVNGAYSKFVGAHTLKYGANWRRVGVDAIVYRYGFQFSFDGDFTEGPNPRNPAAGTGDALASLLLGTPYFGDATVPTPGEYSVDYFGGFVQDDWRLNDKLVLNLGLRIEHETGLAEAENRFTVGFSRDDPFPIQLSPPAGIGNAPGFPLRGGLIYPGQLGLGDTQWDPPAIKLGPRAGFAYSLDDKTVIRGGVGVYWAPYTLPASAGANNAGATGFTAITNYFDSSDGITPAGQPGGGPGSLTNPYVRLNEPTGSSLGQLQNAGSTLHFNDQFRESPYITKWSIDYQRDIGDNLAVKVGYVGSRGSQLSIGGPNDATTNINQLDESFLGLGSALDEQLPNPFFGNAAFGNFADRATLPRGQLLRPYPQFQDVFAHHVSNARSTYNAMRFEFEKRFRGNWGARVNYTFSSQKDNIYQNNELLEDEETVVFMNGRTDDDFGPSRIESPHWLNLNLLYRLPSPDGGAAETILGGWSVSTATLFRSGFPLAIKQSSNNLGSTYGFDHQRPNLTGSDPSVSGSTADLAAAGQPIVNSAAFTNASAFTPGDSPHTNTDVRSPTLVNWDVSFDKTTPIGAGANLVLRFEMINLFNNVNWRGPFSSFGTSNFGQIPGVRGFPRIFQFNIKVNF